jgi:hypothetical protein
MPNGSSKGKGVDKSSSWSQWQWDDRGFYVASRYGPSGSLEYDYRYPNTQQTPQQEQQTPRTPGESVIIDSGSAVPPSSGGTGGRGYAAQEGNYSGTTERASANTVTSGYNSRPATSYTSSDAYYTIAAAAGSQSSSSTAANISYSPQGTRSASSASNTGSFNSFPSPVASPKSDYVSSSKSYDVPSDVTASFGGMTISNVPSTIREQGNKSDYHLLISFLT